MRTYNVETNNAPPSNDTSSNEIKDIQAILDMIIDALDDESRDYAKYMELSQKIEDTQDSGTIKSMAYDEFKHRRLFEEIYSALSGHLPDNETADSKSGATADVNLMDELTDSLFDELDAVEFYRDIRAAIENTSIRDILYEVITDEQSHAQIINYIIFKHCIRNER